VRFISGAETDVHTLYSPSIASSGSGNWPLFVIVLYTTSTVAVTLTLGQLKQRDWFSCKTLADMIWTGSGWGFFYS